MTGVISFWGVYSKKLILQGLQGSLWTNQDFMIFLHEQLQCWEVWNWKMIFQMFFFLDCYQNPGPLKGLDSEVQHIITDIRTVAY